jgi:hypothetical protein
MNHRANADFPNDDHAVPGDIRAALKSNSCC